jgi:hypothetical protein
MVTSRNHSPRVTAGLVLVGFLIQAAVAAAGVRPEMVSVPVQEPIAIDGDPADWAGIPIEYLWGSVRVLAAAHDVDNLYLTFRFKDARLAERILCKGVILWLNGRGKEQQDFGIRYTGSVDLALTLAELEKRKDMDSPDVDAEPSEDDFTGQRIQKPGLITVFTVDGGYMLPENNLEGPAAASARIADRFCYEFLIPLAQIGGKVAKKPAHTTRTLKLGIQLGGLSEEEQQQMKDLMREFRGGGDYRGPGGGIGSGPGGRDPRQFPTPVSGRPDVREDSPTTKILQGEVVWIRVILEAVSS